MLSDKLSKRELDVLLILWSSDIPLSASDIPKCNTDLSINTVQAVLKNLLKKGYIDIANITYRGTVLTRTYTPTLTQDKYLLKELNQTPTAIMAKFIENEENPDTLDQLEKLIQQQKDQLMEGK